MGGYTFQSQCRSSLQYGLRLGQSILRPIHEASGENNDRQLQDAEIACGK